MPHSRFFLETSFHPALEVVLTQEEAHHLQRVMRKTPGACVELVNGQNQLARGEILFFDKKGAHLKILQIEERPPPAFPTILCQALPKPNRLDILVEKGTELGMTELWLFPAERSEKKELSPTQLKRLETISISAMKQCGRLDLPKILLKPPLLQWASLPYPAYFGDVHSEIPFHPPKERGLLFFTGPESGFSPSEEGHLRLLHAQGVRLHSNILRTDTASLTALAIFHAIR